MQTARAQVKPAIKARVITRESKARLPQRSWRTKAMMLDRGVSASAGRISIPVGRPGRWSVPNIEATPMTTYGGTTAASRARIVARRSPLANAYRSKKVSPKKSDAPPNRTEQTVRRATVDLPPQ
jgi:hypothetical protein